MSRGLFSRIRVVLGSSAVAALLIGGGPSVFAQQACPCPCPCPAPAQAAPAQAAPGGAAAQAGQAAQANQPAPDLFAQAGNEGAGAESFSPNMIGDFFYAGIPCSCSTSTLPSPGAGILGRDKACDNNSPIPKDRVFCDYSYFHNANLVGAFEVNRFTPGFEKTFLDGLASVEMMFPVGSTMSPNIDIGRGTYPYASQFGNMEIVTKALIVQECNWALAGGLGITVPTAPGLNIYNNGVLQQTFENDSVHLMPYFGLVVADPCDCWFGQAYIQVDVDANGNKRTTLPVTGAAFIPGTTVNISDQTLLYADFMVGRWLMRNPCNDTGLAAVFEGHYTTNVSTPTIGYTAPVSILDLMMGVDYMIGKSVFTVGYGTPVTNDRGFDGELRVTFNRYF